MLAAQYFPEIHISTIKSELLVRPGETTTSCPSSQHRTYRLVNRYLLSHYLLSLVQAQHPLASPPRSTHSLAARKRDQLMVAH
jgi:hypothetical protein